MSPLVPGPAPRRVVVLRHGETDHNAARIWQGHLDTPLSDLGVEQADAAGPAIAALSPHRIVSSDLTRARLTAESVGRACGIP
ncbi:MAG TPA: histidine phosphatase family protein, partial [Ornithinibacter sp.]|nr:histidine phosphatase family protein [Ornithinibacter sp.]